MEKEVIKSATKGYSAGTKVGVVILDLVLSLVLCAVVCAFAFFIKSPLIDLTELLNVLFEFLKKNIFFVVIFICAIFLILRIRISAIYLINKKNNNKVGK